MANVIIKLEDVVFTTEQLKSGIKNVQISAEFGDTFVQITLNNGTVIKEPFNNTIVYGKETS